MFKWQHMLCFCIDLHEETAKTIFKSIGSKHSRILNVLGGSFASPSGRTHIRKTNPKQNNVSKYLNTLNAFTHTRNTFSTDTYTIAYIYYICAENETRCRMICKDQQRGNMSMRICIRIYPVAAVIVAALLEQLGGIGTAEKL